jgi:hypothetical protein
LDTLLENQLIKSLSNYRGVPIRVLLDEAKILMPDSREKGVYYVLITTVDGQKTIFSWNELYGGPAGDKTILLFEADGRPISKDGATALICVSDIFTESRYMPSLKSIEVTKI